MNRKGARLHNTTLLSIMAVAVALAGLAFAANIAAAADRPPQSITPRSPERSARSGATGSAGQDAGRGAGSWLTTGGALLVVLVLIVGTAKVLQRRGLISRSGLPADALEVLGRSRLDERTTIHLVRCGSRLLLLGGSPAGLTALAEFTDPAEVQSLIEACRSHGDAAAFPGMGRLFPWPSASSPSAAAQERAEDPAVIRLRERMHPTHSQAAREVDDPHLREAAP